VVGAIAFTATVILTSPFVCTTTVISGRGEGSTECSNALGLDYSGGADYDAPMWPALLAGAGVGLVSAWAAERVVGKRSESNKRRQNESA
jgi:hypothetical protein